MTSKQKVVFELNTSQGSKVKKISIHPVKNWVGIINENNTFSLWNYQQKILIKSFSCNTLDDNKTVEIKQVVFFDRHSLCTTQDCRNMKNNIIFVTNSKLIFYNYITDEIKQTSQKDLDQKIIRKVCVYSQTKICIALSDGSFKILDTKDSQAKGSLPIRTVRGYHNKPITWIFAYSQNYNQMPRVITASDQDGMMACWNIDMILKSPPGNQFATPCFKFQSASKKAKESISNEQIVYLQYDASSYRIITVNDSYIRLWSTMTGMETKRIKNTYKYREVSFFNHFTYGCETFVAHSKQSKLVMIRNNQGSVSINNEIDLRSFFPNASSQNPNEQLSISSVHSLSHHSGYLFVVTNYNISVLQLDKFYCSPFGYHHSFSTKLSTINSRQFINKAEGELRKDIKMSEISNINFQQDILINTFYLSVQENCLWFNLLEIQYNTMLYETRKYRMFKFDPSNPLTHSEGRRSVVLVNFEGNEIVIFNKLLCYYEIYQCRNLQEQTNILGTEIGNRIDFYSKFQFICGGYAKNICYHQYRNQFAAVVGFDDKGQIVEYTNSKTKKGLFKGKQIDKISLSATPSKFRVFIYEKYGGSYKVIEKSPQFQSKSYRVFNLGALFAYSVIKGSFELIQIISSQKNGVKEIQGILNVPEQIYVSYCESYYVMAYQRFFVLNKMMENGAMGYFRTFEHTILNGYFWEKFFFFVTQRALYFLHILNEDTILIKIAEVSTLNIIEKVIQDIEDDDFEPECQLLPPGQLQIAGLVNMSLILLNQSGNATLIPLDKFPYIVFCLQISSGATDQSAQLYKNASKNIAQTMREAMTNYGMIAPDLF